MQPATTRLTAGLLAAACSVAALALAGLAGLVLLGSAAGSALPATLVADGPLAGAPLEVLATDSAGGVATDRVGDGAGLTSSQGSSPVPDGDESDAVPAAAGQASAQQADNELHLQIPYRSQYDGSTFEWGNCGVAAISMAMEYYGHSWSTHDVRVSINEMTGNWALQVGVDWRYLIRALERRGFSVQGPYEGRGYQAWTLDGVLAQTAQGRPVMLMAHYRSLPGHEEDPWIGDHYLLVLGQSNDGRIVYHDPGFPGEQGAYMAIERERLERAWSHTWIGQNRTAMVILPPQ